MEDEAPEEQPQAEEARREIAELKAALETLKAEGLGRERQMASRDGKLMAMHTSTQRLESNKQLLELRVRTRATLPSMPDMTPAR